MFTKSILKFSMILMLTTILLAQTLVVPASSGLNDETGRCSSGCGPSSRAGYIWTKAFGDAANTGNAESFGPLHNNTLWKFDTGDAIYSSPIIVDDTVFIASWDQKVYALDAETGKELWNFDAEDYIYSSPTYYDGKIYIGTGTEVSSGVEKVYAINSATGSKIWEHKLTGNIFGSPAIYDGKLFVGSEDKYLYVLDAAGNGDGTTSELWKFKTGGDIWSTPAFYDNSVFITSNDCKLYRINLTTHAEEWNFSAVYHFEGIYSSPMIDSGRVFFGSAVQPNGYFYAVSAETGKELWKIRTGISRYGVCSTATAYGKTIFVGSNNGNMYSLNAETGAENWNFSTADSYQGIYSSATLAGGHIYFGSTDGNMYCLNADNGTKVWAYPTGGGEYGVVSSPAVYNGRVYFGGNDWTLYCVGSPRTGQVQIDVTIEPEILEPNEEAVVTVHTYNGTNPLGWVQIRLSAPQGSLSSESVSRDTSSRTSVLIGYSDLNGIYKCKYTAPDVTAFTNVDIDVEASGEGLVTNRTTLPLIVNPDKQLEVAMTPTKISYYMGEPITVEMNITAGGNGVDSSLIKYTLKYGDNENSDFGIANFNGIFNMVQTAPTVNALTAITIEATATKPGYLDGSSTTTVSVIPLSAYGFDILIETSSDKVESGKNIEITITVKNQTSSMVLEGVSLIFSIEQGTISADTGSTDTNGKFKLTYTAPSGVSLPHSYELKVKASNPNFNDKTAHYNISVIPEGTGNGDGKDGDDKESFFSSPLFYATIIIIIAIIVIAVLVLMKAKQKVEKESKEERVDKSEKPKPERKTGEEKNK
jgi:outer membrane protein assembly factor BamB